MRFASHHVLLVALLGVVACTTVPVEQRTAACQSTDWAEYGRNDGLLGVPASERTKKFADCADLGYPVDTAAYQAGRVEGLATYCTVDSGYEVGRDGRRYQNVCPPELASAFLQGYEQGRKEYRRSYRAYPYFGFGLGFGSFYGDPYWGWGHRRHHHGHGGVGLMVGKDHE